MITPTIFIIMIIIPTIIMIIPTILIITIKAAPVINAKLAGVAERQEAKSGGICFHQLGWFLSMILFSFVGKHKINPLFSEQDRDTRERHAKKYQPHHEDCSKTVSGRKYSKNIHKLLFTIGRWYSHITHFDYIIVLMPTAVLNDWKIWILRELELERNWNGLMSFWYNCWVMEWSGWMNGWIVSIGYPLDCYEKKQEHLWC